MGVPEQQWVMVGLKALAPQVLGVNLQPPASILESNSQAYMYTRCYFFIIFPIKHFDGHMRTTVLWGMRLVPLVKTLPFFKYKKNGKKTLMSLILRECASKNRTYLD